ncbi:MAG: hypothetical protein ABW042_10700 [Phenylobacterium sp.]
MAETVFAIDRDRSLPRALRELPPSDRKELDRILKILHTAVERDAAARNPGS